MASCRAARSPGYNAPSRLAATETASAIGHQSSVSSDCRFARIKVLIAQFAATDSTSPASQPANASIVVSRTIQLRNTRP